MDELVKIAGYGLVFVGMLIVMAPLGATFGALGGEIVGWFWGETIISTLRSVGMPETIKMWHIGCTMGFLGAFLRTSVSTKNN